MLATATKTRPYARRPRQTAAGIEMPRIDCRTIAARRFRVLADAYAAELGGDLTEAERSLISQAVSLQLEAERLQSAIVRGEIIDTDQLIRISSTSKRLLGIIAGKAGKREPAGPSIDDIFSVPDDAEEAHAE